MISFSRFLHVAGLRSASRAISGQRAARQRARVSMLSSASRRPAVVATQPHSPDTLEDRTMLSGVATSVTASGFLSVRGTSADEVITVRNGGATVLVDCTDTSGTTTVDTGASLASLIGVSLQGRDGNDTLTIDASMGTITTQIYGGNGDDILNGGAGRDTLVGQAGADQFNGNAGNDYLRYDSDDTVFNGGAGTLDSARPLGALTTGVTLTSTDIESITGTDFADTIDLSGATTPVLINGGAGGDTLTGGAMADSIFGKDGDDTINGGGGNDSLIGGAGADIIDGGAGFDKTAYGNSPAGVDVDLERTTQIGGDAQGDMLSNLEAIGGSTFDDILRGNDSGNRLNGDGGNDLIEGRGGSDRMDGGAGIDLISYESSPVGVRAAVGQNVAAGNFSGGDATGDVVLRSEDLVGSEFADILSGFGGNNLINGLGGNDTISGQTGDDILIGGDGNDTLNGGGGADFFDAAGGDDVILADADDVVAGTNELAVLAGTGNDRLDVQGGAVDWTIAAGTGLEQLNLSAGDDIVDASAALVGMQINGLNGADTITGTAQADLLQGGNGADTINAGDGDDVLRGGNDDDILNGEGGTDQLLGQAGDDTLDGGLDGLTDLVVGGSNTAVGDTAAANAADPDTLVQIENVV